MQNHLHTLTIKVGDSGNNVDIKVFCMRLNSPIIKFELQTKKTKIHFEK